MSWRSGQLKKNPSKGIGVVTWVAALMESVVVVVVIVDAQNKREARVG